MGISLFNLEELHLSGNRFSGPIPHHLCQMTNLTGSVHNLWVVLDGEIPNGGPFVNFTSESFVHNSALCGPTRFQVPPCMMNPKRLRPRSEDVVRLVTRGFSETNLLGSGGIGSVYNATLSNGQSIAVKVFNLELKGAAESFVTETEILSSIRHRNLIRVFGCCVNAEFKALVLAYMPNGSLEKLLYSDTYYLNLVQRLNIAVDVALALECLHHHHTFLVVHCDIKPSNVLLDQDMTAHLADFGVAKLFGKAEAVVRTTTFLGTIGYAPPAGYEISQYPPSRATWQLRSADVSYGTSMVPHPMLDMKYPNTLPHVQRGNSVQQMLATGRVWFHIEMRQALISCKDKT
ncbi:hypothetical protein ACS0TY_028436 [Phlomoides rotata]